MIPDNHGVWLCKFGEKKWIIRMLNGEISFSCIGAFINQAKRTRNNIQGDLYEGVFARLRIGDARIDAMKGKLGNDLEVISDNDHVLLRRKSSKYIPIFCFYAITPEVLREDVIKNGLDHLGDVKIRHDFDQRMFDGFADTIYVKNVITDEHRFCSASMRAEVFTDRIKYTLAEKNIPYEMNLVNYEEEGQDEYFINPTDKYTELFYKRPEYKYQCEARVILHRNKLTSYTERYNLSTKKMTETKDYGLAYDSMYVVFDTHLSSK